MREPRLQRVLVETRHGAPVVGACGVLAGARAEGAARAFISQQPQDRRAERVRIFGFDQHAIDVMADLGFTLGPEPSPVVAV